MNKPYDRPLNMCIGRAKKGNKGELKEMQQGVKDSWQERKERMMREMMRIIGKRNN